MSPQQHLEWLEDNVTWLEDLEIDQLKSPVPSCPGWSVEDVVNHLSFGLGLSYPEALAKAPEANAAEVFAGVPRPDEYPTGYRALATFSINMRNCLATFGETQPEAPCWTYAGPGAAKFWFRRAAIETTLHRMDIEEAVYGTQSELSATRVADAVLETVEFALPLAADLVARPAGRMKISSPILDRTLEVGHGARQATITGDGQQTLLALWGRDHHDVSISGDHGIADDWLTLIQTAFAGT
jgi:uncharacterized protein (TIGR03083 family)